MQAVSFRLHFTSYQLVLFSQEYLTLCCSVAAVRVQHFLCVVSCRTVLLMCGPQVNTCELGGFIPWILWNKIS